MPFYSKIFYYSIMVAIPPAAVVGHLFDNTVLPMIGGFAVLGCVALAISLWADHDHPPGPIVEDA